MNPENIESLKHIFKVRCIYEMCLEDLEMWEGFDKIYPSYVRFPECFGFNMNMWTYRKEEIRRFKRIINNQSKIIDSLLGVKVMRDERVTKYLKEYNQKLNEHLIALRKMRDERKKELKKAVGK